MLILWKGQVSRVFAAETSKPLLNMVARLITKHGIWRLGYDDAQTDIG